MPQLGQVFPIAEDRSVDVPAIEPELRRLWAGDQQDDAEGAVTRVCTLNLVAVSRDVRAACRASEAGAAITGRYPCRVIIATADASAPDSLEASISAYCHAGAANDKPICCERISVFAAGHSVERLPWVITGLLAPDVPVFLWFQGDPDPESEVFRRLAHVSDRLIVDLQTMSRAEDFLPYLAQCAGCKPLATDMAWRRTFAWREWTAGLFDAPASRAYLPDIREIRVGYTPGGAGWAQAQPALLGAWLCDRLGWKPGGPYERDGDTWTLNAAANNGPGTIVLFPEASRGAAPGEISSVLFPECDSCPVLFSLRRSPSGTLVEAEVRRPDAPPLVWNRPLPGQDMAWLLGQELERPHGSRAFERVVSLLAAMAAG